MEYNLSKYNEDYYILFTQYIKVFGDIYEFGVYGGKSLEILINDLSKYKIPYRKVFGFDSFEGLPKQRGVIKQNIDWAHGNFNAQKLYNLDKEGTKKQILNRTNNIPTLIDGFFKKTLTTKTIEQYDLQPASYINIDVDLYKSTCRVLHFIFSNKLYQSGTIIRYDDWYSGEYIGEAKAHKDIIKIYNIQCYNLGEHDHIKVII